MNVGYVHTFEVPENNIDKGRLKVSVVNEENVPIKGAAVRLSYTGNPDNIIGESGTDGDGISIFNDLRTPPIEYSMEPGNRQPFSEYDIAVSAPGFDNVNISGSDMFSGELSIQNVKMSARDNSQNNIVIPVNTLYGDYPPKIDEEEITSGKLLKKMTEILLMESRANYRQLMNKHVRNAFYEEWLINGGYKNADLEDRGMALGIDINKPRRVFIASIDELDNLKDSQQGQAQIAKFENDVDAFLNINNYKMHFRNASRQIIIIDNMDTENVVKFAGELAGYVWEKDKFELNIGIDSAQSYDMHEAYVEAHRAWTAAAEKHEQIICYEDISLELLISNVPTEIKLEYLKKVFKDMDYNDVCENIALLKAYFNAQGSIQKAADNLYIHKNTLQYRISKLKEITGLDVRKPTESPALYLAYIITDELINEKYDLPLLLHNTK